MKVDVRGEGLTPDQTHAVASTVRTTFREFAQRIASVLVVVSTQAEKRHAARNCVIEVYMADGHVEYVQERQRRLGSALRRAVQRAWRAACTWLKQQLPVRPAATPPLAMAPVPVLSSRAARPGDR
ncbi:hypothetical protein [Piscinibacter gummiphilus]|uniref:Ribosomal subunit interface protein n=1 Tax=Piscinibacter gummiphilus TaxID=946333 RepID=A0ABZ0D0Q2_9BURK|nr:hypothetical protein [Piscinibacter gummiphilus]WOB10788.1 hypothetical protein RXV79_12195 [Piscinibacter gummiphilus]